MKRIIVISVMIFSYCVSFGQNKIIGKITDPEKNPLVGATIFIQELNKGTVSNPDGTYEFTNLPKGKIKIQFSMIGFQNHIETVLMQGQNLELNITLFPTILELEEIVVSGGYNSTQHKNAVKIDVLKLDPLYNKTTPNFMEVLTKVPGVDMISKGSGVAKPVIRGLSMNDVLVLNNSVRFENYQYSDHHPLGIDEFGIEDVEIIKGPASLLYGSDAIGGVINFIKENPAPVGTVKGDYNLQLFSNTMGMSNNLGLKGASNRFFGGLRAGHKTNSDYLQGGGEFAPNTRTNELSLKANAGYTDRIGTFKLFYDYSEQKLGLAEDEAIEQITERGRKNEIFYQQFNTHLLSSQNMLYLNKIKLELNSAFQNTELIHFGELNEYELQMALATLTYDAKLHLPSDENSEYIIGFQGLNQTNTNLNDRETILLPDATTRNYSAFTLLQYTFFEKLRLQSGIRYDYKTIATQAVGLPDDTTYRPSLDKRFGTFSGSIGATLNLSEQLLFRTNFASAYRTPNLAELTSNGQHELRFEKGDANLLPQKAYETDLSIHLHKENFTIDLAGFYNIINNYIFIAPTGDTTAAGISIYQYKQANSTLLGGEAGLHIHPKAIEWLHFETTFASVIGKQNNGDYLPFVPAHNLRIELRSEAERFLFFKKAFIAFNTNTAFNQNNPAPEETPTAGYSLLDLSIGGNIKMQNQSVSLTIGLNNLLDTKYVDHLSTLKEVNLLNPGRNITLSLRIPFAL